MNNIKDYGMTIVVPVYNEQDNIFRLEEALQAYILVAAYPSNVLFVNDGSEDKSQEYIEQICSRNKSFSYISFQTNKGLSTALKAGIDYCKTNLIGYIDADLQTSPLDFNLLLKHITNYEMVTGVRIGRKDDYIKNFSSKFANGIRRIFTKDGMVDTGCPLKILKTESAKRIPMFRGLHRFLPAMVLLQGGVIKQVPVSHYPRIAGEAKFGLRNRILGPLGDCFAYLWMKKKYINYTIVKES